MTEKDCQVSILSFPRLCVLQKDTDDMLALVERDGGHQARLPQTAAGPPVSDRRQWVLRLKTGGSRKQPYYIKLRDGEPLAFAGLWDRWHPPDGQPLETCTILTTTPNEVVQTIHDRMPVILPPSTYDLWLDPTIHEVERLQGVLVPYAAEEMIAYPVSTRVNNPAYDSPDCIAPAT